MSEKNASLEPRSVPQDAPRSMADFLVVDPLTVSIITTIQSSPKISMAMAHSVDWGGIHLQSVRTNVEADPGPRFATLDAYQPRNVSQLACDPLMLPISGQVDALFESEDEECPVTVAMLVALYESLVTKSNSYKFRHE
jgi:hypothetical protein